MPIYTVTHRTTYTYNRPVGFGDHRLMFRPRDSHDQRLLDSAIKVFPAPTAMRWIHDVFGNCVTVVSVAEMSDMLRFETSITLEHTPDQAPDFTIDEAALTYPFKYGPEEAPDLLQTIQRQHPDPNDEIGRWARQFTGGAISPKTGRVLMTLCYAIQESFAYTRRTESGTQPPLFTLHQRRGTCRDFALFMMEAVRSLGFAARFVTGYIYTPSRDSSQKLGGGSTHAWCQVYVPGAGWVEFDPTNGIVGNRDLIRVAVARTPHQAIPLHGTYDGLASDFRAIDVQVTVTMADTATVKKRPSNP